MRKSHLSEMNNNNLKAKMSKQDFEKKKAQDYPERTVWIIFGSLLLDLLAFTMILPLLPSLLDHYRGNDGPDGAYARLELSIKNFQELIGTPARFNSVLFGGFLGSIFSFLQFLASPIVGGLSDVYGRKPVLLCSLVCHFIVFCQFNI